ncbi:membrane protein [Mycobacterium marinum]|nr:membrane protein [Mycobacterium marinum]GJO09385.1 membrane protein [Mycobacterium marinum]GJO11365.1 membrane protein [Mycobacterium marinum]GJO14581.1 membrane protein [Mycobacterium marinum]GJO28742.1 membrane protein [Mycobacterium marinum]
MPPSHRSIVPNIPGAPWWGAVLIAVSTTALGYAFDAGHKDLTHVFAGFYIVGCIAAVLAVRQSGVFTAVIQPPLILFITVPGAYWLFHSAKIGKFKDLLINCGYPLIERFPLMLGTAGTVLLIGLIRWYIGMAQRTSALATGDDGEPTTATRTPILHSLAEKLSALLGGDSDDPDDVADAAPPAPEAGRRSSRSGRSSTPGNRSTTRRTDRTRSRRTRPPVEDQPDPGAERPRRRRPTPPPDNDAAEPPRRARRRPRPPGDSDLRATPPRQPRRDPHTRRNPYESYERPAPRTSRFDPYSGYEPPEAPESFDRYERRAGRYEPYEPFEPFEPPRRRGSTGGPNNANPKHHPISQVRYRGAAPRDEGRDQYGDEPRPDRRSRPRAPRRPQAESWEYDV